MSEKVHEEESSCRSTKQGEACLQGVRTMRVKGAHSGGEQESGEVHEREVSIARTGSTCTRSRKHTYVASGKSRHVKEAENPNMRDERTAMRDGQSAQEGQMSDRVGKQEEGKIVGDGEKTGVAPDRDKG